MSTQATSVAELAYDRIGTDFLTGDRDPFFEMVAGCIFLTVGNGAVVGWREHTAQEPGV